MLKLTKSKGNYILRNDTRTIILRQFLGSLSILFLSQRRVKKVVS